MGLPLDPAMSKPTYENLREKKKCFMGFSCPPVLEGPPLKMVSFLFLEDVLGWRECEILVTHVI